MTEPIIGIIAGAGPFAGLDLATKILEQTDASCDQEYLPMVSVSTPGEIVDRTRFLLGESEENPAYALAKNFLDLQLEVMVNNGLLLHHLVNHLLQALYMSIN